MHEARRNRQTHCDHKACVGNVYRWIKWPAVLPEPLVQGLGDRQTHCDHKACVRNMYRRINLRSTRRPSSSSSGRELAVCSARLSQHGAKLSHQNLQALWLAWSRLDVPAAQADEAHLGFAALASELGHLLVGPGGLVAA